ncbi:hypothetical protein [Flavobacterium sp. HJJ]|uniref:hypothetical protein n=1 Tax=Flavobacterium sp. HJJ TaxID=2783792 RepID=UPI00188A6880|nr:hypothetical protein [Flavobacterium sp. HJJ]MBF4470126.1 hypothetical protein [Flavobacterium sp. HJJ]
MRKIIKIICVYLVIIFLSNSCTPDHLLISDIDFTSASIKERKDRREFNDYLPTSIFKKDIVFIISYHTDYIAGIDLGFSNKCYAFTKGSVIDNDLLESSYSIKLNRPFTYNNKIITENQNLLEIDIKNQISIFENYQTFNNGSADRVIEFSQNFKNLSVFSNDDYKITFNCKTSDNRAFEKNITVKFEN